MTTSPHPGKQEQITISHVLEPGDIGEIVTLHGHYYGRKWGLNDKFEAEIAKGVGDLAILLLDPASHAKNRQWVAKKDGHVVGAIAIQEDIPVVSPEKSQTNIARLRRFIVSEEVRGSGLGNRLMNEVMAFCRQAKFDSIILWTYLGLDQARHLYEKNGFVQIEEKLKTDWGKPVTYVKFKCVLNGPRPSVQQAGEADRDEVVAMVEEYCRSVNVLHRDTPEQFESYFAPGGGAWLARIDDEVIGCVMLRPLDHMPGCCEVKRMYVKEKFRGLCTADMMLHALHEGARAQGYKWCYLDTKDDLKAAHRFYQRHGYEMCDRYNQNSQATIFMRRSLSSEK